MKCIHIIIQYNKDQYDIRYITNKKFTLNMYILHHYTLL